MIILKGDIKKAKLKKVILYIVPFYNHYYGVLVFNKKPILDEWGFDDKLNKPHETTMNILLDYLGINFDYKKLDFDFYKNEFKKNKRHFEGGLMAEVIKIEAVVPIDSNKNPILP